MRAGYLDLFRLLEFAARNPRMPAGRGGLFAKYTKLTNQITASIPKEPGWYWWGKFDESVKANNGWQTVYLGKSENRQTSSLSARIREELKDERIAIWATVFGTDRASQHQHDSYSGRYDIAAKRSLRKANTHFIIWVSDVTASQEDVIQQEKALIRQYRPPANRQKGNASAATPRTVAIIQRFQLEIDNILGTA